MEYSLALSQFGSQTSLKQSKCKKRSRKMFTALSGFSVSHSHCIFLNNGIRCAFRRATRVFYSQGYVIARLNKHSTGGMIFAFNESNGVLLNHPKYYLGLKRKELKNSASRKIIHERAQREYWYYFSKNLWSFVWTSQKRTTGPISCEIGRASGRMHMLAVGFTSYQD